MRAVAVAILGPGPDVDDVVQDAALVALTRIATLRDPHAVRQWLTGIIRNLCRQTLVRRHADHRPLDSVAYLGDADLDPAIVVDRQARDDWVWSAVNALSEPLRQATVLRYFSRASSYEAIAAVLGLPVGTVRSRLNQARTVLAQHLERLADAKVTGRAALVKQRGQLMAGIYAEYNSGLRCDLLHAALVSDAELRVGGTEDIERGREAIVGWLHSDDVRIPARLLDVVASCDITVAEISFANPDELPEHCPPVSTHVYLHDGAGVRAMRLHYAAATG